MKAVTEKSKIKKLIQQEIKDKKKKTKKWKKALKYNKKLKIKMSNSRVIQPTMHLIQNIFIKKSLTQSKKNIMLKKSIYLNAINVLV